MIIKFLKWYYIDGLKFVLKVWQNFLVFNLNYFSVPLLLRTLFSPWKRYQEPYGRGVDLKRYLNAFFSNILFRFLGFVARLFLIIICFILHFLIILLGMIVFVFWLFLPVLLITGVAAGGYMIHKFL